MNTENWILDSTCELSVGRILSLRPLRLGAIFFSVGPRQEARAEAQRTQRERHFRTRDFAVRAISLLNRALEMLRSRAS